MHFKQRKKHAKAYFGKQRAGSVSHRTRIHGHEFCYGPASDKNVIPAQIALAWVLAQKPWIVPIPGTTKLARMEENLGAANVELATPELENLNDALSMIEISGDRYPAEYAKRIGK